MTQHPDLFAALAAPFEPHEVKVRSQSGRNIHYITARMVMNRLDEVLGPENWWDEYEPSEHSVLCRLTIRMPEGLPLTKADAGGYAGMPDSGDDDKSGYSDAFKRAAVKFGIARYLYRDGVPAFIRARVGPSARATSSVAPASTPGPGEPSIATDRSAALAIGNPPRTGRALFAWTREQEQRHEVGLLEYLNQWARPREYPGRMVDWNPDQVGLAYQEACRKLLATQSASREAYEEALSN